MQRCLGGDRDFRLKRGTVCDECNRRRLKRIDDEMELLAHLRWARADLGLGAPLREFAPGITFDDDHQVTIDATKLGRSSDLKLDFDSRGRITSFTLSSSGPSMKSRGEHLTRGLHRMAYNAIAHERGRAGVLPRYRFLRELVLDLEGIAHRAYLADESGILPAMQRRWSGAADIYDASYTIAPDNEGNPALVGLRLGPLTYVVSVQPTTSALALVKAHLPGLRVYSVSDS